ncbi:MAG: hypothetical protein WDA75_23790 [Candidatus Latescibacterota bacterium]|jgi:hypothetical protein
MIYLSRQQVAPDLNEAAFREVLATAREGGYRFARFNEVDRDGRLLLLRHDVDVDLYYADRLSAVEQECGAVSTYFVMLHNPLYNPWSREGHAVLREIVTRGQAVGLHFDPRFYGPDEALPLPVLIPLIESELEILSAIAGVPVDLVSFHQPLPRLLNAPLPSARFRSTYAPEFTAGMRYIADSAGRWREESILELLRRGTTDRIQFLSHPVLWLSSGGATLQERLEVAVGRRQQAVRAELAAAVNDPSRQMVLYE